MLTGAGHKDDEMSLARCTTEPRAHLSLRALSFEGLQQQGAERAAETGRQKQK